MVKGLGSLTDEIFVCGPATEGAHTMLRVYSESRIGASTLYAGRAQVLLLPFPNSLHRKYLVPLVPT